MPNPASQFQPAPKTRPTSVSHKEILNLQDDLDLIQGWRILDAVVVFQDPDYYDKFKIDIFESGFGAAPTIKNMDAVAPSNDQYYELYQPCKVVLGKSGVAIMLRLQSFWFLKPLEDYPPYNQGTYYPNQIKGYVCSADGFSVIPGTYGSDKTISINVKIPSLVDGDYGPMLAPTTGYRGYASQMIPWFNYNVPITMPEAVATPINNLYSPPVPGYPAVPAFQAVGFVYWRETIPKGNGIGKTLSIVDSWGGFAWDYPVFS